MSSQLINDHDLYGVAKYITTWTHAKNNVK